MLKCATNELSAGHFAPNGLPVQINRFVFGLLKRVANGQPVKEQRVVQ